MSNKIIIKQIWTGRTEPIFGIGEWGPYNLPINIDESAVLAAGEIDSERGGLGMAVLATTWGRFSLGDIWVKGKKSDDSWSVVSISTIADDSKPLINVSNHSGISVGKDVSINTTNCRNAISINNASHMDIGENLSISNLTDPQAIRLDQCQYTMLQTRLDDILGKIAELADAKVAQQARLEAEFESREEPPIGTVLKVSLQLMDLMGKFNAARQFIEWLSNLK